MKAKEQQRARQLRQQGYSVREITKRTGCAKSSISKWVRGISLTPQQIARLESNQDRGRAKAANHPNSPKHVWSKIRSDIIEAASKEIPSSYSPEALKLLGVALYWGEGSKVGVNMANFSNSDPAMVRLMMGFFRRICKVPQAKFRGIVHIHPHLNAARAKRFWSHISGIPPQQFYKTQTVVSRASQQKRDTLPLGTFKVSILDTRIQCKLLGWIKGMQQRANIGAVSSAG